MGRFCPSVSSRAALLIILIQFATLLNSSLASRKIPTTEPNTEFIRTSCSTTTDPVLCFTTFSRYACKIQGSPRLLAGTALSVALNTTSSTSTAIIKLSQSQGLKPTEIAAMRDCEEELKDSVDELKMAIGEMESGEGKSFGLRMSEIQTWVSAAMADEDTCMDGFPGTPNENLKTTVRGLIVKVAHMTSITLAFINRYAATHNF